MVVSFFTDNLIIQTSVFVVSSGLLIFLTKPFVNKYITKKTIPTNTNSLIGKRGKVAKDITQNNEIGLVKVGGETWSAISENEVEIKHGTEVEIKGVQGVKLIVSPVNEKINV